MLTLLTLTFHFQIEVLFEIKQQNTLQNSIHIHTTQNWKGTFTRPTTASSHTQHYDVILDVLMETISALFNYILSLPMLL